jgi:hypothetical protein
MKKTVVPTTAARGAAVSNRRMTAVQSVYIPAVETLLHHLRRWGGLRGSLTCNESFHGFPSPFHRGALGE